ncbi:MAG: ankyrin repeat domain-containing protein [bacterium]
MVESGYDEEDYQKSGGDNRIIFGVIIFSSVTTALQEAMNSNQNQSQASDVVNLLLMNGANPNVTGNKQRTPLHYAAFSGNPLATKLLLKNGANPNTKSGRGLTPYKLSMKKGHNGVTTILKEQQ